MTQPATVADELSNTLIDMLTSRAEMPEMEFYRCIKKIENLQDHYSEAYLKALANAVYGRFDDAVAFFETALNQEQDLVIAQNYIVYLFEYGSLKDVQELTNRVAEQFVSKTILSHAWESHLFTGEIEQALKYASRIIKITDGEEAEAMRQIASQALAETNYFKERAGLSDQEFKEIATCITSIMGAHKVRPVSIAFHSINEENTTAYVMTVESDDADLLAEMNMEVAFTLAGVDSLIGKNFSAWFEGGVREEADYASN
ncbi:hypothetical protein JTF19_05055 [Enterobacteriaceae bacterium RIT814]|nr:hypothetical protein [Enterobacteriaceae bacterium RIT 814]